MRKLLAALALAAGLFPALAWAGATTYNVTQGTGTAFRAYNDGTANLAATVLCDPVTDSQCLAVNSSGQITVLGSGIFQVSPTTSANAVGNPFYVAPGTSANFAGAAPMQSTGGTVGLVAGTALVGKVGIDQTTPGTTNGVSLVAATAGGVSAYHKIAAASDNHTVIKNGAGQVYGVDAVAAGTTIQYIRLYDAGTGFNGCNSATGLIWGQQVPAPAAAAGVGGGYVRIFPDGLSFSAGISICITGAVSDTDTTNAATTTVVNVSYK
jgi:hypothetical protein